MMKMAIGQVGASTTVALPMALTAGNLVWADSLELRRLSLGESPI